MEECWIYKNGYEKWGISFEKPEIHPTRESGSGCGFGFGDG